MHLSKPGNQKYLSAIWSCIVGCSILGVPAIATSQEWRFEPIIRLTAEYNDNFRLETDDEPQFEDSGVFLDANARFVRRAPTSEIRIAPRIRTKTYSDNSTENSVDSFFDLFARRTLRRGEYGIQARFSTEDVLTAELDDPDFDNPDVNDPINVDSGRSQIRNDRERIVVSPFFSRELTETLGFGIDANYVDVAYDRNPLNYADYSSLTLGTSLIVQASQRSTWSIRVYGDDYEAESNNVLNEISSIGATVNFQRQIGQTTEGRISVGYEEVDTDVTTNGLTTSGTDGATVFAVGLTQQGEISRFVVDARQAVDPSGDGFLQKRAQFRLRYTRQLSPKTFANIEARVQNSEQLSEFTRQIERDFQRYRIGFERRFSTKWSLVADVTHTRQRFTEESYAVSSAVSVGFIYQPARIR